MAGEGRRGDTKRRDDSFFYADIKTHIMLSLRLLTTKRGTSPKIAVASVYKRLPTSAALQILLSAVRHQETHPLEPVQHCHQCRRAQHDLE
jgi:hypothetical protein